MKRMLVYVAMLMLSGCATWQGNGPADVARRNAYISAHPGDKYAEEIRLRLITVGMSMDDVTAMWGDTCHTYGESQVGTSYLCQPDTTADQNTGTIVLFDNSNHVVSWVN
jgi:hypothetical protein